MSTTPINTHPVQSFITSTNIPLPPVQRAESWLKHHEKMILAIIGGLVLWFAIGKIDTLIANHDAANLQQAKVVAQVQQSKNDALTAQIASDKAAFDAQVAKLDVRDAQLQSLQVQLVTALAKQQHTDATLPPTELVARFNTLVPAAGASVVPNGVMLPEQGAVATIQELENVPVLKQELTASQEQTSNVTILLGAETKQVTDRDSLISGLRLEAVDQTKVCTAQIAVVKAAARKSKRHWFIAGVVTGWIGRQLLKTYTGL